MIQDRILYTDGRNVTITDTMFQVRDMSYRLIGITRHGLHIVKPHRLPAFLVVLAGVVLIISGFLNLTPENFVDSINILGITLTGKTIIICAGCGIMLLGVLILGLLRERYAVRIATAEGEKDVVVSSQKEYVTQIVSALNRAFNFIRSRKQ